MVLLVVRLPHSARRIWLEDKKLLAGADRQHWTGQKPET